MEKSDRFIRSFVTRDAAALRRFGHELRGILEAVETIDDTVETATARTVAGVDEQYLRDPGLLRRAARKNGHVAN